VRVTRCLPRNREIRQWRRFSIFLYDAFELLPGAADVEVRCEGGRVTLTGSVQHKRVKRDIGEIAWAIPGLNDVQNNVTVASRRRNRAGREKDEPASISARKQG
jgi:hypothetical protein